ncbi:MAG: MFS transporter [Candidatus Pacearchaeota archaeon]
MVSKKLLKEKAKKISIIEGSSYAFSEGFGLRNVSAYALALNSPNYIISLLTSIPSLLGNLSQFLSYRILLKTTRKKAVSILVFLQALSWLMFIIPGVLFLRNKDFFLISWIILIIVYSLVIIFGSISGPIWTSWMKDIVKKKEFGRYFSYRNKIVLIFIVFSSIIAGLLLDFFKKFNMLLIGFFILFFLSFIARVISAYFFTKKYEPKYILKKQENFTFGQFINNMAYNNFGSFVIFLSLVNFFVAIASPFFVVYLIKMKGLSYTLYSASLFIMTISSILTMSFWGKISDRSGNMKIIKLTLIGIIIIPLFYFFSNYIENKILFIFIIFMTEAISGFCWGGFNLASFNFILKIVSKQKIVYCTTYLNVVNGITIFFGAIFGGLLASMNNFFIDPILFVFLISFLGRAITYIFILPKIKEEKGFFSYDNKLILNLINIPKSFLNQSEQNYNLFNLIGKLKNHFNKSKTF